MVKMLVSTLSTARTNVTPTNIRGVLKPCADSGSTREQGKAKQAKRTGKGSGKANQSGSEPDKSRSKKLNDKDLAKCCACSVVIDDSVRALQCDRCGDEKSWKCLDCLEMSNELYVALQTSGGNKLKWFCDVCEKSVFEPDGVGLMGADADGKFDTLLATMNSLMDKFINVESRIVNVETKLLEKADVKSIEKLETRFNEIERL